MGLSVSKRRAAREMAVQMLYQRDLGQSDLAQIFNNFDPNYLDTEVEEQQEAPARPLQRSERRRRQLSEAFGHGRDLVRGTLDHLTEIDRLIREQADNWRLERMPAVDRNVLRLAIYEMLFEVETPKLVVVDEAIELAKKFGSEQSARFVNGLLDGLLKSERLARQVT